MMVFVRPAAALAVLLATLPATGAPPRCREVPAADALRRLAVWGREWAGARGPIIARAGRRVAVLAGRDGAMLEALFWVALDAARGPAKTPPRPALGVVRQREGCGAARRLMTRMCLMPMMVPFRRREAPPAIGNHDRQDIQPCGRSEASCGYWCRSSWDWRRSRTPAN